MCYTSDLQTSPIFTVDYYKGVAKSAAEAGAHMIGIKVSELTTTRQQRFFVFSVWYIGRCSPMPLELSSQLDRLTSQRERAVKKIKQAHTSNNPPAL